MLLALTGLLAWREGYNTQHGPNGTIILKRLLAYTMKKIPFPLIGFILGIVAVFCLDKGLFTPWKLIGKPENSISQLLGANEETLYVSTETGSVYSYTYWKASSEPENLWKKVIDNNIKLEPNTNSSYFTSPPMLQRVKQKYQIAIYPLTEAGGVVKFYLFQDGNVWMWKQVSIGMGLPILLIEFSVMGLIIGVILHLIIRSLIKHVESFP